MKQPGFFRSELGSEAEWDGDKKGCQCWLSSNVKWQENQGEVGLRLQVHEGGSIFCGPKCKSTTHSSAPFCCQRPIKRQIEHTERGRDGGRADEEEEECEWNGGKRLLTDFSLSSFFCVSLNCLSNSPRSAQTLLVNAQPHVSMWTNQQALVQN